MLAASRAVSKTDIEERRLSTSQNRFNRLWRGLWVSDHGDALQSVDIDKAATLKGPMAPDDPSHKEYRYVAGLDIGLRKDATALVIVGRHVGGSEYVETGRQVFQEWGYEPEKDWKYIEGTYRYRVADVEIWRPSPGNRVSLEAVRFAVLNAHKRFNLSALLIDPHQGEHLAELLRHDCVPVQLVPQIGPSLNQQATALVEAFQQRVIDLYPEQDLLADVRALQIAEKSYGVRLVSPRSNNNDGAGTAHGDTATALSIALRGVGEAAGRSSDATLDQWLASGNMF